MNRTGTVLLEFDPDLNKLRKDKKLWDGLSAVVQIGDTLWVANDEALRGCEKTGSVNFPVIQTTDRTSATHTILHHQ